MSDYRTWFLTTRPWSLPMSIISVSVGAAIAAADGPFSLGLYLLTCLGMAFLHIAGNMTNDYFDVQNRVDTPEAATAQYRPHPLVYGQVKPAHFLVLTLVFYALAAAVGLYLSATRGWTILGLGLLGAAGAWTYTGPPLKFKYLAFGELAVFLLWGPLMIVGSYFVQRQTMSLTAFWASLPFGALVALVLLANNLRDMSLDGRCRIRTLPMIIGKTNGLRLYIALIALAYLSVVIMSLLGPLTVWSLLVLLSLPLTVPLVRDLIREVPNDFDARTAKLDTGFGALLVISLVLGHLL